jgi:hypothetical protein
MPRCPTHQRRVVGGCCLFAGDASREQEICDAQTPEGCSATSIVTPIRQPIFRCTTCVHPENYHCCPFCATQFHSVDRSSLRLRHISPFLAAETPMVLTTRGQVAAGTDRAYRSGRCSCRSVDYETEAVASSRLACRRPSCAGMDGSNSVTRSCGRRMSHRRR